MSRSLETARGTVHRWQCDHMGHVNVRAYAEFFEEPPPARVTIGVSALPKGALVEVSALVPLK